MAACADLRDVRLFDVRASLGALPDDLQATLRYSYNAAIEVQQLSGEQTLIVDGTYAVEVALADLGNERPTGELSASAESDAVHAEQRSLDAGEVARLEFQFAALYQLTGDDVVEFPEDELDAFGQTTGLLALHPYAREFVATMTGRMGLPPLHIGTAHIYLDKRNDGHD